MLDTDIPSKPFVSLQDVLETTSRHAFKPSLRYVFSATFFRLQRRLRRPKIVTLKTCTRRLQGMPSRCLEDQQMFAGNKLAAMAF